MVLRFLTQNESSDKSIRERATMIPSVLKRLLCLFSGYFDGRLYKFSLNNSNELTLTMVEDESFIPRLLIVARQCYTEEGKEYPIESKSELNKILSIDNSKSSFHYIWGANQGVSKVNRWQFNKSVPQALFTLPESLLLSTLLEDNQIMEVKSEQCNSKSKFIGYCNGLVHSSSQSPLIDSVPRFAMSVGIAVPQNHFTIEKKLYIEKLILGLKSLTLTQYFCFMKGLEVENRAQLLKNIALPFCLALSGYLAISSAFLGYKHVTLQQELANQSAEVNEALLQQQKLDDKLIRYSALQSFFDTQLNTSPLWLVLAEVFSNARLTNIRKVDNRIIVRGSTAKATDVLEAIGSNTLTLDAKFDFPVRRSRNQDVFVISFKLAAFSVSNLKGNKHG